MKFTLEHRQKISKALMGHILSKETKSKISIANKGKIGLIGKDNPMYGKFGELNPMWGRKHSDSTKEKISLTSKGRWLGKKHKEESKIKCSESHKRLVKLGIHPSWKGGRTSQTLIIRTSKEYRDWRRLVFERDNYTCQVCGQIGGKLNVDHVKSFSSYPELRFDINNGRTLCLRCHVNTDTFGPKSRDKNKWRESIKNYWNFQ